MKIPLFPLEVVLFPGTALPLHIFESRYKEMVEECISNNAAFGVVRAQRDGLAVIGCAAQIVCVIERYADGRLDILCQGLERFEIESLDHGSRSFLQAEVDFFVDDELPAGREMREQCLALHFEALELLAVETNEDLNQQTSFQLASSAPCDLSLKQELLATRSDAQRTARLIAFYNAMLPKLRRGVKAGRAARHNGHVM